MLRRPFRSCTALLFIFAFMMGLVSPVLAAEAAPDSGSKEAVVYPAALGKIPFGSQSYAEIQDVHLIPDATGKTVSFTVNLYNGESSDILLIDYWVTLHSKAGAQFSTRLAPEDKEKSRVPSKTKEQLTFYAHVNDKTQLTDLVFRFIRWDFSQPNFEREYGKLTVPNTYKNIVPFQAQRVIQIDGVTVKTKIERMALAQNDNYYLPTIYFRFANEGTRSFDLPDFRYFVQSSEGLMYPLKAAKKEEDKTAVHPLNEKEVILSGSVPVKLKAKAWKLILAKAVTESETTNQGNREVLLPVAVYELPEADRLQSDSGKEAGFSTEDGVYTAKLNGISRLPWEDRDLLLADLTISNKGKSSLPIPDFAAYYMLDDSVKVEAQVVRVDKLIGLEGGQNIDLQIIGKVPYTYQFSTITLYLQNKEDEDTTNDLLQFKLASSQILPITAVSPDASYMTDDIGRRFEYSVRSVDTFTGKTSDLFAVHLDVKNLESRYTDLSNLVGQFRTPGGMIFPAASTKIESKIRPGGKGLLSIYAVLPKGVDTSKLQLILGQAVTEGKLTEGDKSPDAYVNAIAYQLPQENKTVSSEFENIEIYPYTLTLRNIKRTVDYLGGGLRLEMEYELAKDYLVEANMKDQRVVIAVEDDQGLLAFTEEFQLEGEDAEKSLQIGKDVLTIEKSDRDLLLKLSNQRTYYFNVYYQFAPGQKKLLASERIFWFNTNRKQ